MKTSFRLLRPRNLHHLDEEIAKREGSQTIPGRIRALGLKLLSYRQGLTPNYAISRSCLMDLGLPETRFMTIWLPIIFIRESIFYPLINVFQCYQARFLPPKDTLVAGIVTGGADSSPAMRDLRWRMWIGSAP